MLIHWFSAYLTYILYLFHPSIHPSIFICPYMYGTKFTTKRVKAFLKKMFNRTSKSYCFTLAVYGQYQFFVITVANLVEKTILILNVTKYHFLSMTKLEYCLSEVEILALFLWDIWLLDSDKIVTVVVLEIT